VSGPRSALTWAPPRRASIAAPAIAGASAAASEAASSTGTPRASSSRRPARSRVAQEIVDDHARRARPAISRAKAAMPSSCRSPGCARQRQEGWMRSGGPMSFLEKPARLYV
jgi:hypothetical protein